MIIGCLKLVLGSEACILAAYSYGSFVDFRQHLGLKAGQVVPQLLIGKAGQWH